jgi:uncharacterized membrane protein
MIDNKADRIRLPEAWAALFFSFTFMALVTMPTGSPSVVDHLGIATISLVVACFMTAIAFERRGY